MKEVTKTIALGILPLIIFMAGSVNLVFSQNKVPSKLSNFMILLEPTDEGIKLTCETGCAWKELAFNINRYKPQAIDQNGMMSLSEQKASGCHTPGGFVFTIEKTNKGFSLQGIEGTSWVSASSSCSRPNCRQYIGHQGIWEQH